MIAVAPGALFEAVTDKFAHLATVALRIRDNSGADFLARTVVGVSEDLNVGTAAVFRRNCTAPTTAGQFTLVWDDGTNIATEELLVTYSAPAGLTGSLYVTRDELKLTAEIAGSYADDDIDLACEAASRGIDGAVGQRFYTDTADRYFTADRYDTYIDLGPVGSVTAVVIDADGDGTYETTWAQGTDFYLDPPNAVAAGYPYTRLQLRGQAGRAFPSYARAIKVSGMFGWEAVPAEVRQFAKLFAAKLLIRSRQAPLGFQALAGDVGGFARIARTDPDFDDLLGHLVKRKLLV